MVESETDGSTIDSPAEPAWRMSIVAAVEGEGETSCPRARENSSSSGMQNESSDGDLVSVGEHVGERGISMLPIVER